MKTFYVYWSETHSVNIQAKNEEEAIQKAFDGKYYKGGEEEELDGSIKAYEIT